MPLSEKSFGEASSQKIARNLQWRSTASIQAGPDNCVVESEFVEFRAHGHHTGGLIKMPNTVVLQDALKLKSQLNLLNWRRANNTWRYSAIQCVCG